MTTSKIFNYETKLGIIDYFNQNMSELFFVIAPFKELILTKTDYEMHFTDLEKKIKNGESIALINSQNFHQTGKNLEIGSFDELSQGNKQFHQDFMEMWKKDKEGFEKEYLIFLHYLSDLREEGKHFGISLFNKFSINGLKNPTIVKEFINTYSSKEWTHEEFLCLNDSMINPLSLILFMETNDYISFVESFEKHAKRLKISAKTLTLDLQKHGQTDTSLLIQNEIFNVTAFSKYNHGYVYVPRFPNKNKAAMAIIQDIDISANIEYVSNHLFTKNLPYIRQLIKETKVNEKSKINKYKNSTDFIDVILDQREYEYVVFDVELKGKNYVKIFNAFDALAIILADRTGAKLTLQRKSSGIDFSQSFIFKVDVRCYSNKDDLAIYLKDLLIEMFSLDVKTAHNQIKQHEENVPMINTLIEYTEKTFNKNKEKKPSI